MSDKNLDQINIPAFFNKYYVKEVFTIEETIALSFDIDPDKICFSTEGIHDGQEKYYQKDFQEEYYRRLEIVREAVLYDNTLHDIEQEYVLFYIQQKNRWPKLWPLKAIELCKKKRFPFSVVLEKLIKGVLEAEDLKVELEKAKNRINELEEQLNKKSPEDDLNKTTKKGYDQMLAIMAKISENITMDSFNANNISNKAAKYEFNFRVMSVESMRKYLSPARKLLGYDSVSDNTITKK